MLDDFVSSFPLYLLACLRRQIKHSRRTFHWDIQNNKFRPIKLRYAQFFNFLLDRFWMKHHIACLILLLEIRKSIYTNYNDLLLLR